MGLVEHDLALPSLLESLLAEVPAAEPPVTPASRPAAATASAGPPSPPIHDADATATLKPAPKAPLQPVSEGRSPPSWARQAFRALLFRVGDHRFAMPLVLLRGVASLPPGQTVVPGTASWHLGLVRIRGETVTVADLGGLAGIDVECGQGRYLLLVADGDAAVLCDAVDDAALIEPAQVRWYRGSGERNWLAGLLAEQMCVLLDGSVLGDMIRHG
jgi:purine-binding chemotaxis protein CheW